MEMQSFLGNLILCCGLCTAVATTSEPPPDVGRKTYPPSQTPLAEEAFVLPQNGVVHVTLEMEQKLVENIDSASIKFTLTSPSEVNALVKITPDYPRDSFEVRFSEGHSFIAQPGEGGASAWADGRAEYTVSFGHNGRICGSVCVPTVNLFDVCHGASPCTIGFTLERTDLDPMSELPTSVMVSASAPPLELANARQMLRVRVDD